MVKGPKSFSEKFYNLHPNTSLVGLTGSVCISSNFFYHLDMNHLSGVFLNKKTGSVLLIFISFYKRGQEEEEEACAFLATLLPP